MKIQSKTKKGNWRKLPKSFKEKWVKALRSGRYEQGFEGSLCETPPSGNNVTYCCLGVACSVGGMKVVSDNGTIRKFSEKRATPKLLHGNTEENHLVKKLVEMNDDNKFSFKQIANWIQKNL